MTTTVLGPSVRHIEAIEDLPFRAVDKWYVLLALLGLKKASWVDIASDVWREGDAPLRVSDDQIDRLKKTFDELGLAYTFRFRDSAAGLFQPDKPTEFRQRYNQILDVFVAGEQGVADELKGAVVVMDHRRIGTLLGYPETAVAVFGTESAVSVKNLPDHKKVQCEPYVQFMLSRQHYEEELGVVQKWYDAVLAHSQLIALELRREK